MTAYQPAPLPDREAAEAVIEDIGRAYAEELAALGPADQLRVRREGGGLTVAWPAGPWEWTLHYSNTAQGRHPGVFLEPVSGQVLGIYHP